MSSITLVVDGRPIEVPEGTPTLLDALRDVAGATSVKDGCSPQGQCGCCTVLVDGAPRVACVTPVRRLAGREITTFDGLDPERRQAWTDAFLATGASQCGFCTPGIVCRLEGLAAKAAARTPGPPSATASSGPTEPPDEADRPPAAQLQAPAVHRALAAHLCRCTGWQTITEAAVGLGNLEPPRRDAEATARASFRAVLEGGTAQAVGADVVAGRAGFAADTAPADAAVVVPGGDGGWTVADTLAQARLDFGKVQGRRSTVSAEPPLAVPEGEWAVRLATSWVEPAYLETDASWCEPGGEPATPLANGGAFGGKLDTRLPDGFEGAADAARRWADRLGRPVRVVLSREDVVRYGAKRPPIAAGLNADGTGRVRVGWSGDADPTPVVDRIASVLPSAEVEVTPIPGPPTSPELREAGWAEAQALAVALAGTRPEAVEVTAPEGGRALITAFGPDGIGVSVSAGAVLDEVVLRSYCIGAGHAALGWVATEGLAVDDDGEPQDLTIRSFGILRSADLPPISITIDDDVAEDPAVPASGAVFAAVAAATWSAAGFTPAWPLGALPWAARR
ncbi:MAG: 2Fe-2S iron-sulfur cluster-binding protein [Microthrixaceae bacterium]